MRLLVLLMLLVIPAAALADQFAVVRGGRLNLREYADVNSRSLGKYNTGTWVTVEGNNQYGWCPVRTFDGKRGYMDAGYLTFAASGNTGVVRYANGGYVNLRQGPSLEYPVLIRVTSGTTITIVDASYEWNYVAVPQGGRTFNGYMHDSFIDKKADSARVVTRNGGKVNVRSGPTSSYHSVGSLASGTTVSVLLRGNGWSMISGGGLTGFMSNEYLSGTSGTSSTMAVVNNPRSTQVLNLRECPSQAARSIGQYRNGTQVKVVRRASDWCEVYVGTRHGYMMTRYLRFGGSGSVAPPPVVPPVVQPTRPPMYPPSPERSYAVVSNPRSTQVLYLRAEPNQNASVRGQYKNGTQVRVAAYGSEWCEVYVGDKHGYMMTRYLDFYGAVPNPVPTATPAPWNPPVVPTVTPIPVGPSGADAPSGGSWPSAGTLITLNVSSDSASDMVNVYRESTLTSLRASYYSGKQATMLQYGPSVCMILLDGEVGYVSTSNIRY